MRNVIGSAEAKFENKEAESSARSSDQKKRKNEDDNV